MSLTDYVRTREYIVTVKNFDDLESLYSDLETEGSSPEGLDLKRPIQCLHRRDTSRNTHYLLTDWEASELRQDSRVKSVELSPKYLGIKAGTCAVQQTSSAWDKSGSTSSSMKNWGLLRCTEGTQRTGWAEQATKEMGQAQPPKLEQ